MTEYMRISTSSRSATARASPTGRTLKPRITAAHDVDLHLALRQARDLVLEGLERAGHVRLEHEVELLDGALLDAAEDLVEGHLAAGAAGLGLVAQPDGALVGLLARRAVVLDD